ncbi:putative cofilin [Rosellinia necatrix]|uniref:Cofilin n=1 Tax=Rosellinia necatrix TaxID=77044 RepID=A0A1W2TCH6_ROSNE|nr:putative cofilin [Rosellinia necatrix]
MTSTITSLVEKVHGWYPFSAPEIHDADCSHRNKITFIAWSPDDAGVMPKMVYASSKEGLKRALTGVAVELQANDPDDIEYDVALKTISKGLAG